MPSQSSLAGSSLQYSVIRPCCYLQATHQMCQVRLSAAPSTGLHPAVTLTPPYPAPHPLLSLTLTPASRPQHRSQPCSKQLPAQPQFPPNDLMPAAGLGPQLLAPQLLAQPFLQCFLLTQHRTQASPLGARLMMVTVQQAQILVIQPDKQQHQLLLHLDGDQLSCRCLAPSLC